MVFKKYTWLAIIASMALMVRLFNLDNVPYGFHIDEAKAGWNAYSLLTTGRDDKGNFLPVYYDSFGDFRPAGLLYLIVPSLLVFGKSIVAVRFPFALIGALTTIPLYLFSLEISKNRKQRLGMIAALLLAFNPWHIVVSRSTCESVIAIFLTLWGLYFFVKMYRNNNIINSLLTLGCLVSAFFFYHNIRVLGPIFLCVILLIYRYVFGTRSSLKQLLVFGLVLVTSMIIFLSPESRGRMSQVSLKSDFQVLYEVTKMPVEEGPGHVFVARAFHNRIVSYTRRFAEEYKEYFGTSFLLGNTAKPTRYSVPQVGLMTYVEMVLVVIGLFWVSKRKEMLVILALLMLAPLPAAITIEDTPNMQRAIFILPFLLLIAAVGLYEILNLKKQWRWLPVVIIFGYVINFIYFYHMYTVHQPMGIASYYRNGGGVELINNLADKKNDYSKIVLTNSPDDLYTWLAFGLYKDAKYFNTSYFSNNSGVRKVDKYVFSKDKCPSQRVLHEKLKPDENTLYVDAEDCNYDMKSYPDYSLNQLTVINRPDGSPPYYLRIITLK